MAFLLSINVFFLFILETKTLLNGQNVSVCFIMAFTFQSNQVRLFYDGSLSSEVIGRYVIHPQKKKKKQLFLLAITAAKCV